MRCGIFASAHYVPAGGSGVTVEEVIAPANVGASATGTIPITTDLQSADLVIALLSRSSTGALNINFNGVAWTRYGDWQVVASGTRLYAFAMTGMTGTGNYVGYTTAATTATNHFTVFVVRGLSNPAISAAAQSALGSTTPGNTEKSAAAQSVGNGQVAVMVGIADSGTPTFPSSPTPSTGWVSDRADGVGTGASNVVHQVFSSAASAQTPIKSSTTTYLGAWAFILGDAI